MKKIFFFNSGVELNFHRNFVEFGEKNENQVKKILRGCVTASHPLESLDLGGYFFTFRSNFTMGETTSRLQLCDENFCNIGLLGNSIFGNYLINSKMGNFIMNHAVRRNSTMGNNEL